MTTAASLHERIGLEAPPGELKRLADIFDRMLDRMEGLVGAQRRFAANAAQELRTPLVVQRGRRRSDWPGTRRRRRWPGSGRGCVRHDRPGGRVEVATAGVWRWPAPGR